jgi:hypothetical protein
VSTDYTSVGLIKNAKRRGFFSAAPGYTNPDWLATLTEQMRLPTLSFLKGLREEYVIAVVDLTVTSAPVDIPQRAAGAALRKVQWACGNSQFRQLSRIEPELQPQWGTDQPQGTEPMGYMFQANQLVLVPPPSSGSIRLGYQLRPGTLVMPDAVGTITSLGPGPTQVTISATPSTFTTSKLYDFVKSTPNFQQLALDQPCSVIAANVLTFASRPASLAVGDYVCLAGETPVPPFPTEVHDLVAQLAAAKVAQSSGSSRYKEVADGLADVKAELSQLLSPRSDGSARPIVNRIGAGWRRRGY